MLPNSRQRVNAEGNKRPSLLAGVFFYEVRHRLIAVEIVKDRINDAPLLLSARSLTASKRPNRRYCPSKHVCCVFHGFKHLAPYWTSRGLACE